MYCIKGNTKKAIASVETRKRWHSLRTHLFNVVEKLGEEATLKYVRDFYEIRREGGNKKLSEGADELIHEVSKLTYNDTYTSRLISIRGNIDFKTYYLNGSFEEGLKQYLISTGKLGEISEGKFIIITWEDVESLLQGVDGEEETVYMFIGYDTPHVEHHEAGKYGVDTIVYTPERFLGER